ncbi:glycosyltransferase [Candidatus Saganbacteria bacterium]|nr:glycosyltransferase [Candidatus Saganbacteria bacterium]
MNILQVVKYYYPYLGGIETYTREIVLGLKSQPKMTIKVLTANTRPRTEEDIVDEISVTRVARFGELFSVPLCPAFPLVLKSKNADIMHFQMPFPLAEFSEILFPKRAKIVVSWHSDIVKQVFQRKLFEPFLLKFLDRVDKILVATPNHITSSLYLPKYIDKCEIVPYGIDFSRFDKIGSEDQKVRALKNKYADGLVLFVGRLVYYKGVEYLIRAMRESTGRLVIIGDGPLKQRLLNLIAELGLSARVEILDSINNGEVVYYYQACDLFVLPSIANSEAFGIAQVEAMACGKPVITTDLPTGVTYVNQKDVTGLVVPLKESAALARAINILLKDPGRRKLLGENGDKRARQLFNKTDLAVNIKKIYSTVLKG